VRDAVIALEFTLAKHVVLPCCTSHSMPCRGPSYCCQSHNELSSLPKGPHREAYAMLESSCLSGSPLCACSPQRLRVLRPRAVVCHGSSDAAPPPCSIPRPASFFTELMFKVVSRDGDLILEDSKPGITDNNLRRGMYNKRRIYNCVSADDEEI
jgi:hypothetical protein